MDYLIIILLGLIIGSFLNVIILRFDELKTIFNVRSHCPKCKKKLPWYDLVPLFSFVLLKGKCRQCKEAISFQYPLVEALTAGLFALCLYKFGLTLDLALWLIISSVMIVIFVYDIQHLLISDILVVILGVVWLALILKNYFIFHNTQLVLQSLYGGLVLGGFLGLLVLISRGKWMGSGDIGLGFVIGALLGWTLVLVAGFGSFMVGTIVSIVFLALKSMKLKSQMPFAPFLIVGLYLALLFGERLIAWYWGYI